MITSTITYSTDTVDSKKGSKSAGFAKYALQSVVFLFLCIVLLEGYLKLAGVGGQEFLRPSIKMGCEHIPGKRVIWRLEGYSHDRLSKVGLRDSEHSITKEAGTYRIALLGDSAVESLQVDLNQTFGKVLESLLNTKQRATVRQFEVVNFGCSSYSTGQEVLQYESEIDKYQPDAVVLLYNRGDSLENVIHDKDRKHAEIRPYFYLDQNGQLHQDNSVLNNNMDKLKPQPIKDFLREHSAIHGVLTQADLSLTINEPRYRKIKSWIEALVNLPKRFDPKNQSTLTAIYPDQNDMAVTKALIERLANNIAQKNRTFILMIFPNIVHYDVLLQQAKQLKTLADNKHFRCLDLSSSFLADKDPNSNFIQYHFSKKGHEVVASQLMQVINERVMLKN